MKCQLAYVAIKPPRGGPITSAVSPGHCVHMMASVSRSGGVTRSRINRPTGTIIAPAIPCSTRISVNWTSVCDNPHSSDATVNAPNADANTVRAPARSATQPLTGINTATVSRYAVMPMFIATAVTWKLRPICGSAVAMIVPSNSSMKNAEAISTVSRPDDICPDMRSLLKFT